MKLEHHSGRAHFYRELDNVNRAIMNMVENLPRYWFVFRFVIGMAGQFSMTAPPSFQIWLVLLILRLEVARIFEMDLPD